MKAVIIGSGMAGLTAGAYLAKAGHEVIVFEQFPTPGGVTATIRQDGYGWDIGPLMVDGFAPGDLGRAILEELGVSEKVQALRDDRGLVQPEFTLSKPEKYEGPNWRRERLKKIFPKEARNLNRYYRFYNQVIRLMGFARRAEHEKGLAALWWKLCLLLAVLPVRKKLDWSGAKLMDHYFTSRALKTFFLGIVADFVTAPSEFPGPGVPSIHLETAFDKRVPAYPGLKSAQIAYTFIQGGCQTMVDAVLDVILENGGRVETNRTVKQVLIEGGRANGVLLTNGLIERADVVLASGGMHEVFFDLVGKEHLNHAFIDQIDKNRLMESVLMVQLGIDFDPRQFQPATLCYYYGTNDLEKAVHDLRSGHYHEGKDGLLIYVPSLHSPELAPEGKFAVTIYTVAPDSLDRGPWPDWSEVMADKLVAEAERFMPGLRAHTLTRLILTPDDFRKRTHQKHHSFGGSPPVMGNKAPGHKTPIPGLWFIGAESESGGGVVHVMEGAQKVAKRILKGE